MVMTKEQIAAAFKEARLRNGMTVHDLVVRSNVHNEVIRRLEKGKSEPSLHTVCKLARAYGVRMDASLLMERLKARRGWLNMTQTQLAKKADVSIANIACYETNVSHPKLLGYLRICTALEVDPLKFLEASE